MLRKLYDWALVQAAKPRAERWLVAIAVIDASVFPLPPEMMQVPMSIARPHKALRYAVVGTLASAVGSLLGYVIGAFLFQTIGVALLDFVGRTAEFHAFATEIAANIWLWPVACFLAPMVAAIAAGSIHLGLGFILPALIIGRGARFVLIALLLRRYGDLAARLIDRYFSQLVVTAAALVAGFVLVRFAL